MSEPPDNRDELIRYRFIDDGPPAVATEADREIVSVEYFPSVGDAALLAERISKQFKPPTYIQTAFQAFFIINTIAVPALLIYADLFPLAVAAFVLNSILVMVILPNIMKRDYRRFYGTTDPTLENEVVSIELQRSGVFTKRRGDHSFNAWQSFTGVEETKEAIFLYLRGARGIAVRKTGFAYENQKDEFLAFARAHIPSGNLTNGSDDS